MSHPRPAHARRALPLVLVPFLTLACTSDPVAPEAVPGTDGVVEFETAWQAIHDTYFDPEFNGLDWQGIHDEFLPRVQAAASPGEVRGLIGEMLGRLEQSHFAVIPADALPPSLDDAEAASAGMAGGCGFDVRFRDGQLLVTEVHPDGPAGRAGVRTGWILDRVGDRTLADTLEKYGASAEDLGPRKVAFGMRQLFTGRTYGEIGSSVELAFRDESDAEVILELERAKRDVIAHAATTTLPTFYLEFDSETVEHDGRRIGIIHFTNWFLPMALKLDEAIHAMRDLDGIVIDLRGNGGGALAMCMGLGGHFFSESVQLGTMQFHDTTMKFKVSPRRIAPDGSVVEPYGGPLAIIIDETSGSASECFSGGMQSVGRARVFGETSAGAVLPARMTKLPSGDSILHAMADFKTADGTLLEHRGVIPDETVPVLRKDLLAGDDAQLSAALRWLTTNR